MINTELMARADLKGQIEELEMFLLETLRDLNKEKRKSEILEFELKASRGKLWDIWTGTDATSVKVNKKIGKEIENLKSGLKDAIEAYLKAFEKKYDGEFEKEADIHLLEPRWFGEYVFSLDDIIRDLEYPQHSGEIFKWWDACVDNFSNQINFRSWLMGARFK